jgi:hypothetical protein
MRKIVLSSLLMTAMCTAFGQTSTDTTNSSKIIFMRSTGFQGSFGAFTTFIDDQLACRLNNKRFSSHFVAPGEHFISVQFAGSKSKEKAERIKIKTEAGKTYYVQLIIQNGAFVNNLLPQEVTENSANLLLPNLKEDTDCQ